MSEETFAANDSYSKTMHTITAMQKKHFEYKMMKCQASKLINLVMCCAVWDFYY